MNISYMNLFEKKKETKMSLGWILELDSKSSYDPISQKLSQTNTNKIHFSH